MDFKIDTHTGLIEGVEFISSPNCDERELSSNTHQTAQDMIDLVVLHNISLPPDQFGGSGVVELFTNRLNPSEHPYYEQIYALKVSAHVFIRRDGQLIQFVPFHKRAWHAGVSSYQGRERCNNFSIGIELEGTDTQPFTHEQYASLNALLFALITAYPNVSAQHITGHSDIAPGRKTDPGPYFDWAQVKVKSHDNR